jgi:hypothetical protein|tara:strand:+ start:222 stop:431 length:210 start_codon:yes stop_codon:yes gene_type:complete
MAMIDDPYILTFIIVGGIFAVAYGVAYAQLKQKGNDDAIEATINHLCREGYIKHKRREDGELELMPLKE